MDATSIMYLSLTAQIILGDLRELDKIMNDHTGNQHEWMMLIKQQFIAIANLVDFEAQLKQAYKSHPELASEFKFLKERFEFANYLRNYFGGHVNAAVLTKALEWKPELQLILKAGKPENAAFINFCILETAINSYVGETGGHKIFEGDTDLNYPDDMTRFLIYLTEINTGARQFLENVLKTLNAKLPDPPTENEEIMALFASAGLTDFKRITSKSKPELNRTPVPKEQIKDTYRLINRAVAGEIGIDEVRSILKEKDSKQ